MIRLLALAVIVALAAISLGRLASPGLAWVLIVPLTLLVVSRRRWPRSPGAAPSLIGPAPIGGGRRHLLRELELEISSALDSRLGGDTRLRRRLIELVRYRAGLDEGVDPERVAAAVGGVPDGPLTLEGVEELVDRIEKL